MPDPVPELDPRALTAGTTWAWRRRFGDPVAQPYSPAAGWALQFVALDGAGHRLTLTSTPDDHGHLFSASASATASHTPGVYQYQVFAVNADAGTRYHLYSGALTVAANLATSDADPRSATRRLYDAIMATLAGRATKDADVYTIEGQTVARTPIDKLISARNALRQELRAEEAKQAAERGERSARVLLTAFTRPGA